MKPHTTGPWQRGRTGSAMVVDSQGADIAIVNIRILEADANARLISYAPELLEALERTTANIGLIHVDYLQQNNTCAFGVDRCPCPLAKQWRNNTQLMRKAGGEQ